MSNGSKPAGTYTTPKAQGSRGKQGKVFGGGSSSGPRWRDVNPVELAGFIARVTENGDGVVLTTTSDGGALSITVLHGSDRTKAYPKTPDEFLTLARDICDHLYD